MNDVKVDQLGLVPKGNAPAVSSPQAESRQAASAGAQASQAAQQQPQSAQPADQQQLKEAVTQLNDYIQSVQRDLRFQMDDSSGKTVITVVDRKTDEVVRQIPDDVALRLAQDLQQSEPLSLFNMKV